MSDWYLLLTPILMLGVVALLGFVGCDVVFGLDEVRPVPPLPAPTNFQAVAANGKVNLSWDAYTGAIVFKIMRRMENEVFTLLDSVVGMRVDYEDPAVTNGTKYYYQLIATVGSRDTMAAEADATPGLGVLVPFVDSETRGTRRNDFTGWVGMGITVGTSPLKVKTLGRWRLSPNPAIPGDPGNTGTHVVKIFDKTANADVPGATVMVAFNTADAETYKYIALPDVVILAAGRDYYIVSRENAGGDEFHDSVNTTVTPTAGAASRVYAVNGDDLGNYNEGPPDGRVYGPLSFQYEPN